MLEEIRTLEKIEATDKEMNEEADKMATRYQAPKEEILAQISTGEVENE